LGPIGLEFKQIARNVYGVRPPVFRWRSHGLSTVVVVVQRSVLGCVGMELHDPCRRLEWGAWALFTCRLRLSLGMGRSK
jgi:hypothetical protein